MSAARAGRRGARAAILALVAGAIAGAVALVVHYGFGDPWRIQRPAPEVVHKVRVLAPVTTILEAESCLSCPTPDPVFVVQADRVGVDDAEITVVVIGGKPVLSARPMRVGGTFDFNCGPDQLRLTLVRVKHGPCTDECGVPRDAPRAVIRLAPRSKDAPGALRSAGAESERIEALLVAISNETRTRSRLDGRRMDSLAAAERLRERWTSSKAFVHTAEDFILECATKSDADAVLPPSDLWVELDFYLFDVLAFGDFGVPIPSWGSP